jgi:hypothetical protein
MPLLPHTGLLVPDDAPRVVAVSELAMTRGLCWVAHVRLGDRHLGTIENAGNGQETEFFPVEEEPQFTSADFTVFAVGCQRDGRALDEQQVMELLVEEFECAAIVRDVRGHTGTYARQVTAGRITGWAEVDHRPRTHAELTALARQLSPRPTHAGVCAAWQVWTGERWRTVPIPDYD